MSDLARQRIRENIEKYQRGEDARVGTEFAKSANQQTLNKFRICHHL